MAMDPHSALEGHLDRTVSLTCPGDSGWEGPAQEISSIDGNHSHLSSTLDYMSTPPLFPLQTTGSLSV